MNEEVCLGRSGQVKGLADYTGCLQAACFDCNLDRSDSRRNAAIHGTKLKSDLYYYETGWKLLVAARHGIATNLMAYWSWITGGARWPQHALDRALTPMFMCDAEGQITLANVAAEQLLGRAGCSLRLGEPLTQLINVAVGSLADLKDILEGRRERIEFLATVGLLQLPVELRGIVHEHRRRRQIQFELHDVQQRVAYEAELRARLEFKQQLIEAIPLPFCLRDFSGKFVRVNRAFEVWHDVSREEVIGQTAGDVLPASVTLAFARCDALARHSDLPVDQEVQLRPRDGESRYVQLRVQSIRQGSALDGFIAIESDVSRLREQEAQLSVMNVQLERVPALVMDAQEKERRKLARDLHDDVGQVLTALKINISSMARTSQGAANELRVSQELVNEALQRVRDVTASLYPQVLDNLGFEPAIVWLIERFIRPSLPDITLRCRLEPQRSTHETEIAAFRVVQEALTNIIRHSGATRAGVLAEARHGELLIEVIDDGCGFARGTTWFATLNGRSIGIASMIKRIEEVGGQLDIDSQPGAGTNLRVRLPWPDADVSAQGWA